MRYLGTFLAFALVPAALAGEPGPQLKLLATLEGAWPREMTPIVFSPDGKLLACADFFCPVQKEGPEAIPAVNSIKLWDVGKRKVVATLRDADGDFGYGAYQVAFSPDGKTLAVASASKVRLFDVATRKEKASF